MAGIGGGSRAESKIVKVAANPEKVPDKMKVLVEKQDGEWQTVEVNLTNPSSNISGAISRNLLPLEKSIGHCVRHNFEITREIREKLFKILTSWNRTQLLRYHESEKRAARYKEEYFGELAKELGIEVETEKKDLNESVKLPIRKPVGPGPGI